jgi:hypothetical protein
MTARIVTSRINLGPWDVWQAWASDLGPHASPIGTGRTEAEAIEDLNWMIGEMEAAKEGAR